MVAMNMGWGISVQEQDWRKGPWTPEEDKLLSEYVNLHGEGRWSSVGRYAGLNRSGKSCRLRWVNYLRPGLKRGQITPQEEGIIIELHALWGNKWSTIARYLPGRTDNEIKNFWRTHFNKKAKSFLKQQKRRSQLLKEKLQQKDHQQLQENSNKSTISTVVETSEEKMMNIDHDHQSQETTTKHTDHTISSDPTSDHNNTINSSDQVQCLPFMYQDDLISYAWSDVVTPDQEYVLWGGLWNLDDQSYGRTDNANQCNNMMSKLATSHQNISNNQLATGVDYHHGVLGDNYCSNKNNDIIPIQNQARAFSSCTEGSYIF